MNQISVPQNRLWLFSGLIKSHIRFFSMPFGIFEPKYLKSQMSLGGVYVPRHLHKPLAAELGLRLKLSCVGSVCVWTMESASKVTVTTTEKLSPIWARNCSWLPAPMPALCPSATLWQIRAVQRHFALMLLVGVATRICAVRASSWPTSEYPWCGLRPRFYS